MLYRNRTALLASLCLTSLTTIVNGQTTSKIIQGADGVTYQETRTITERLIPTTEMQTRQEQVYTPQVATNYQSYQQNYLTPVTEYRWVSRRRGILNPFVQPYWAHELEPFTRWENRPATVQVPVTTTNWVAATRTVQTPVTTYKPVKEESVDLVAISAAPTSAPASQPVTAIAASPQLSVIGGQQMQSDPPRTASGWSSPSATNRYR
jgi:hypothetical protein